MSEDPSSSTTPPRNLLAKIRKPVGLVITTVLVTVVTLVTTGAYGWLHGRALDLFGSGHPPPTISISSPGSSAAPPSIFQTTDIRGRVMNLRPDETVWTFNAKASDPTTIYPHRAGCEVTGKAWSCPADIGEAKDTGKYFIIWAAVVTDKTALHEAAVHDSSTRKSLDGQPGQPPHVSGKATIARIIVKRK